MTIVYSDKFLEHVITPDHPESPKRLLAISDALASNGLWKNVLEPKDATMEEIESVHIKRYLTSLDKFGEIEWTADTKSSKNTFSIARLAAGASIIAAERAWEDKTPSIALVRPPGHHALSDLAMGFCYLNNIAIAAKKMLSKTKKIAIVDIDVHHGNGTQDAFYRSREVLYISTHQKWLFPGSGHPNEIGDGQGEGYTINIPMEGGAGDASFELAHEKIVIPILDEFKPGMILVSIGTDCHYRDPLASLSLSSKGYAKEIEGLLSFAKSKCDNRIAFFLEGGYDLEALSDVIVHAVGLFDGTRMPLKFKEISDKSGMEKESLNALALLYRKYWDIS